MSYLSFFNVSCYDLFTTDFRWNKTSKLRKTNYSITRINLHCQMIVEKMFWKRLGFLWWVICLEERESYRSKENQTWLWQPCGAVWEHNWMSCPVARKAIFSFSKSDEMLNKFTIKHPANQDRGQHISRW